MIRKLYNFAAFQAGWCACVLGAAAGRAWIGPSAAVLILLVHARLRRWRAGELWFLAASLPLGLAVNTLLQTSGAVVAPGPATGPLWLLVLWPLFASLFHESMSWMRGRYLAGVAFAAVGAPLSYFAGARAGALALHDEPAVWIGAVVVTWAAAMLALLRLQQVLTPVDARDGARAS